MSELGWQPKFIPIENILLEKIFLSILGTELQRFIIESEKYKHYRYIDEEKDIMFYHVTSTGYVEVDQK